MTLSIETTQSQSVWSQILVNDEFEVNELQSWYQLLSQKQHDF